MYDKRNGLIVCYARRMTFLIKNILGGISLRAGGCWWDAPHIPVTFWEKLRARLESKYDVKRVSRNKIQMLPLPLHGEPHNIWCLGG